jgi:hypothetical protein
MMKASSVVMKNKLQRKKPQEETVLMMGLMQPREEDEVSRKEI